MGNQSKSVRNPYTTTGQQNQSKQTAKDRKGKTKTKSSQSTRDNRGNSNDNKSRMQKAADAISAARQIGGAVSQVGTTVSKVAQTAYAIWKVVKFVKGAFNDPKWYAYHGKLDTITANTNRPFTPRVMANQYRLNNLSAGVAHVVIQQLKCSDFRDSDAFKLAMSEAFKKVRVELRSNLPYRQEEFEDYVYNVVNFLIKVRFVERAMGWSRTITADIPELQSAFSTVPHNYNESGMVEAGKIRFLDDDNYAESLAQYEKLAAVTMQLAIPKKLDNYVTWWIGSVFADQNAPNPQLYMNIPRNIPVFSLTEAKSWDPLEGTIQSIISEGIELLHYYGVIIADALKRSDPVFSTIEITPVEQYQCIALMDPEFFTAVINSYCGSTTPFNSPFVRVDMLEGLSEQQSVGLAHGLAKVFGVMTPLQVVSQAAAFSINDQIELPTNTSYSTNNSTAVTLDGFRKVNADIVWYQYTGDVRLDYGYSCSQQIGGNDLQAVYTTATRFPYKQSTLASATGQVSFSITPNSVIKMTMETANPAVGSVITLSSSTTDFTIGELVAADNQSAITLHLSGITGTVTKAEQLLYNYITIKPTSMTLTLTYRYGGTDTVIPFKAAASGLPSELLIEGNGTSGSINLGNLGFIFTNTNVLNTTQVNSILNAVFSQYVNYSAIVDAAVATISVAVEGSNEYAMVVDIKTVAPVIQFIENVDYHVPLVISQSYEIAPSSGGSVKWTSPDVLAKECYIPAVVNKQDMETVLYWMYLGLFSME